MIFAELTAIRAERGNKMENLEYKNALAIIKRGGIVKVNIVETGEHKVTKNKHMVRWIFETWPEYTIQVEEVKEY